MNNLIQRTTTILQNHTYFTLLIKGTVLGRRCGGASTFSTHNRLSDPKYGFPILALSIFRFFYNFP